MIWWIFLIPAVLAAPRVFPLVDPGLFVISGVKTCGGGGGYCLLGLDCTLDEDFLPDDENGNHCEGLKSAFTPSAHFVCCRAANKTVYKPPLVYPAAVPVTTRTTTIDLLENEIDQVLLKVANAVKKTPTTESTVVGLHSGVEETPAELRESQEHQDSSSLEEEILEDSLEEQVLQDVHGSEDSEEVNVSKESNEDESSEEDEDEISVTEKKDDKINSSTTVTDPNIGITTEGNSIKKTTTNESFEENKENMLNDSSIDSSEENTYEPTENSSNSDSTSQIITTSSVTEDSDSTETTSFSNESNFEDSISPKEESFNIQLQDSSEDDESVEDTSDKIAIIDSTERQTNEVESTTYDLTKENEDSGSDLSTTTSDNNVVQGKIETDEEGNVLTETVTLKLDLMSDQALEDDEENKKSVGSIEPVDPKKEEKFIKSNPATNEVLTTDHDINESNSFHNLLIKKTAEDRNKPVATKKKETSENNKTNRPTQISATVGKNSSASGAEDGKEEELVTTGSVSPGVNINNGQLENYEGQSGVSDPCFSDCTPEVKFLFENETLCFGSIYKTDWVVTSASCALRVFRMGMLMVKIVLVDDSGSKPEAEVKTIVVHESYGESLGASGQDMEPNNIGLVQVKGPVPQWQKCTPCLPKIGDDFSTFNCSSLTDQPMAPTYNCSSPGCDSARSLARVEKDLSKCVGRPRDLRDDLDFPYLTLACDTLWQPRFTDRSARGSGSPLVCKGRLVGLETSRGVGLLVYTPLTRYLDWLNKNTLPGTPDQHFNLG